VIKGIKKDKKIVGKISGAPASIQLEKSPFLKITSLAILTKKTASELKKKLSKL
jgi:hypothetical protein